MNPISIQNAPHYVWGGDCDGWHLMSNPAVSVIQERVPPGRAEVWHYHQHTVQFFYVLDGELTIEVGSRLYRLSAREGLQVMAGEAHQVRNEADQEVVFLVISVPPSHGDRVLVTQ
ncbi:cupin domain-containing protein [Arsenicibacter rosenii]|uniref:Cupin n=1 Tax=Arsenicibacter rosenii TaxID=1750698 RepID=A0A1S2VD72_9BACT|nr:cupin domain-containing protein [Arsenicibacter rosenii]OIN56701.1 cupin [Arsenicibacter rosenii]